MQLHNSGFPLAKQEKSSCWCTFKGCLWKQRNVTPGLCTLQSEGTARGNGTAVGSASAQLLTGAAPCTTLWSPQETVHPKLGLTLVTLHGWAAIWQDLHQLGNGLSVTSPNPAKKHWETRAEARAGETGKGQRGVWAEGDPEERGEEGCPSAPVCLRCFMRCESGIRC